MCLEKKIFHLDVEKLPDSIFDEDKELSESKRKYLKAYNQLDRTKRESGYVFNEDELRNLLKNTWDACDNYRSIGFEKQSFPNKDEYIDSLFKK
jgi:hypothetical protein